ncbi:FadR/GntR family transcriptional regulator [Herbaspirillum lusitanum]|jgi:DNA-binding FadR family transcriptional regulator|uniref:FadR/GntR family transcriptional regulator n=1 Tax=Herbaspirillum lusitanum TaxID=213312 RepID=A0ABW9A7Z3_9BURK
MKSLEPVSVTRLYRMIADQIAGRIRSGEFEPGSRLPSERDLAESLQVSRTSVREALIALELEGFVEVRVGSGVFVMASANESKKTRAVTPAEDQATTDLLSDIGPFELIAVHLMVEPECAALAAQHATPMQLAAIISAAAGIRQGEEQRQANRDFHVAVAAASGNAALAITVANLWELHDNSAIFYKLEQHLVMKPEVWHLAATEHDALIEAILRRDPEAARAAMREHFMGSQHRLGEDFYPHLV